MGKHGIIYEMNQRGPPWLLVKMVFFIYGYFFGIYGENGIYFMVLVLFLMVDVFGVQMCIE
jgi:hypothetical protein